jgi:hypothetical protein
MTLTAEMRQALAASQQAFDDSEIYDNYVPADGTYNCILKAVKVNVGENKAGERTTRTTLVFQILDGDEANNEFTMRFSDELPFLSGNLFTLAVQATGDGTIRSSKSYLRAVEALAEVEGQLVATIRKFTRTATKGKSAGRDFPEYAIEEVNIA